MTSASTLAVRARLVDTIEARLDALPLLPVVVTRLAALDPEGGHHVSETEAPRIELVSRADAR